MKDRLRLLLIRLVALLLRPFARSAAPDPRRILVIKPDHLGDVLLLTPALAALRHRFPQAHITVLVGPWATRLLADNPAVDTLLTCPFPGFVRGEAASILRPYRTLLRYAGLLRAGRFDTAIIARDDHWWGGLLALAAGCGRRVGFAHPLVVPALTSARPWDPQAHVARQALDLVALLGPSAEERAFATQFFPTEAEHSWAATWLATNSPARPLVAIQPGSGGAAKLWPAASWAALARGLADRGTLVLTGGPADAADVAAISALLADLPHHSLVGGANLGQLAALFGRCALVLGVDNGPLHLAVSQAVPTLHLFGPGDHRRFGPWGPPERHVVLRSGLWCSPCGVLTHCPRATSPSECMTTIAVAPVLAQACMLLPG